MKEGRSNRQPPTLTHMRWKPIVSGLLFSLFILLFLWVLYQIGSLINKGY